MSEDSFLRSLREFIHQHKLIERNEKIITAVSGGIDSMVLLDALCELKQEFKLELAVAHFNHELRGKEASDDEMFVRTSAKDRGVECYVEHANTNSIAEAKKVSVQEAARDLRYTFFNKLRTSLGFHKIATAHHADDNAETILFNMLRGAGVHGLSGIPVVRADLAVIRPILFASRPQIHEYAVSRQISYREDSSNAHNEYTRNFLRHNLIPQICENINPNLIGTLHRTGELFDQIEQYLKEEAAKILPDVIVQHTTNQLIFNVSKLHDKPVFLQEHLLMQTVKQFGKIEIGFSAVKTMLSVSYAETGTSCSITRDLVLYRNRDHLILKRIQSTIPFRYHVEPNKTYEFEQFRFHSTFVSTPDFSDDPCIEFIDTAFLGKDLILRPWNNGDWFVPLGIKEKKKLSDFFIDQKIPLFEKHNIPLLVTEGNIVWVCGKRLDDRFKITPKTKNILKLEYAPHQ
jgi:tRNA(Ile)-lysidine synthase